MALAPMELDVVVFGGGIAGLWLLDDLVRQGQRALLLESDQLGQGQTVASQGIIHGGLKYTLQGWLTPSANHIREMPLIWRDCLAGRRSPDLSQTRIRSECCYLWQTDTLTSRLGMMGARFGLRIAPETLAGSARPEILAGCPGTIARLDEQVIAPESLIRNFAVQHHDRILHIDAINGLRFECSAPGAVPAIHLTAPTRQGRTGQSQSLTLHPRHVVFTAGGGNADLRRQVGLSSETMQRRPLHMVVLRGDLPEFNGHCVDGARTRVTITSDRDSHGRTVWQVGGQIAEDGVQMQAEELLRHTRGELQAVIPGLDLNHVEWNAYRVDRAERVTPGGKRPETAQVMQEGNCVTAWPTKLALAPQLAEDVTAAMEIAHCGNPVEVLRPTNWPHPLIALPPWETLLDWRRLDGETDVQYPFRKAA